jgi:hypothetical protein
MPIDVQIILQQRTQRAQKRTNNLLQIIALFSLRSLRSLRLISEFIYLKHYPIRGCPEFVGGNLILDSHLGCGDNPP